MLQIILLHLQRKCSAIPIPPHLSHWELLCKPIVWACLLRKQCPLRTPVIHLMFFLLTDLKYLEFLTLIWMQFYAWFIDFQCFLKDFDFHLVMWLVKNEKVTFRQGSGPTFVFSVVSDFFTLNPGTQTRWQSNTEH